MELQAKLHQQNKGKETSDQELLYYFTSMTEYRSYFSNATLTKNDISQLTCAIERTGNELDKKSYIGKLKSYRGRCIFDLAHLDNSVLFDSLNPGRLAETVVGIMINKVDAIVKRDVEFLESK